jgi:hypothetical protein
MSKHFFITKPETFSIQILIGVFTICASSKGNEIFNGTCQIHHNISTTKFWVGENASFANRFISNKSSAWDGKWKMHFGGTDDPKKRKGFRPAAFIPKENPFYCALPYNDMDNNGIRKKGAEQIVCWGKSQTLGLEESMCKNHWVEIIYHKKVAYAQWEDVGPFGEEDAHYVFGSQAPDADENSNVGLDVSPAVCDYLGLSGLSRTSWIFVNENEVPDGPWKKIITRW